MSVTIRDIAKASNVSVFTVSSVLHNRSHVKPETREKVLKIIEELEYDPLNNIPLAREKNTRILGIVFPDQAFSDSDPFFSLAIMMFKMVSGEAGYQPLLYTATDIRNILKDSPRKRRDTLLADGLLFFCPYEDWDEHLAVIRDWGMPVVLVRRRTEVPGIPVIFNDDYKGARMLMEHLMELGHTRIAYVDYPSDQTFREDRRRAYRDMLKIRDLPVDPALMLEVKHTADTERALEWLHGLMKLDDHPTAFFCFNDQSAMLFLRELEQMGKKVPQEIAVCGYDGSMAAELFRPTITTVDQPVQKMLQHACNLLGNAVGGAELDQINIEVENELQIRDSTKC